MKKNIYYLVFISLFLFMSCDHDESANFEIEVKRLDTIYKADPFNASMMIMLMSTATFGRFIVKM